MSDSLPGILLLDVDGTLLDESGKLYDGALDLFRLSDLQLSLGLCSARPFPSLVDLAERLGNVDFLSASQGALVAKRANHRQAHRTRNSWIISYISWLTAREIVDIARIAAANEMDAWFHDDAAWYVPRLSSAVEAETKLVQFEPIIYRNIEEVRALKAVIVATYTGQSTVAPLVIDELKRANLCAAVSRERYFEIVSAGSSTTKGADIIVSLTPTGKSQLFAVGDSMNDKGMLDFATFSFAFKKSPRVLFDRGAQELSNPEDGGLRELKAWLEKSRLRLDHE